MTNIIAVTKSEHLFNCGPGFGIPADFWIANQEAFPAGTPPTLLYRDGGQLREITISDDPQLDEHSEYYQTSMLFKLVRRTVLRLKDELLQIWEEADYEKILYDSDKFPYCWELTSDQRQMLKRLNARLFDVEKFIYERFAQLGKEHPGHCLSCKIYFILDENDPEWDDQDDNIMAELCHQHQEEYDPSANWNDCTHLIKDENGAPEHLCWLYHELYDHTGLAWEDLPRVGKVSVTIKVNYGYELWL